MGKVMLKPANRERTPRPKRKRRKKDLDKIHSKMLKAKQTLDNVGKGNSKDVQRKQGQSKICNRLLPERSAGIYRNGVKGKGIRKAEMSKNILDKARIEADALKLFNGDTPESGCTIQECNTTTHDDTTKQLSSKDLENNNMECMPCSPILNKSVYRACSPILNKKQSPNWKLLVKKRSSEKKNSENLEEIKKPNLDSESKYAVPKEDLCKRRLFQNDKDKDSGATVATQVQIFDVADIIKGRTKRDETNKKVQRVPSEYNKVVSCDSLNRYEQFCNIISTENFGKEILPNVADPLKSTLKRLKERSYGAYNEKHRNDEQASLNTKSDLLHPLFIEYQACTNDTSQSSAVEFEVPKSDDNAFTTLIQELAQEDDVFEWNPKQKLHKEDFQIDLSRDSFQMKPFKNSSNKFSKRSTGIYQPSKLTNDWFVNAKSSACLDSRADPVCVDLPTRNNVHNTNITRKSEYTDVSDCENLRSADNAKQSNMLIFSDDSMPLAERYLTNDHPRNKSPIMIFDGAPNVSQKHNDQTGDKHNAKNAKRVPTILRRCNNVDTNRVGHPVDHHVELLYRKPEVYENPNDAIIERLYEMELPRIKTLPMSSVPLVPLSRSMVDPQIEIMKIKDARGMRETEKFEVNMRSRELNKRNRINNGLSRSWNSEASYANANANLSVQQQEDALDLRKPFHVKDHQPVDYLQDTRRFSNFNMEMLAAEQLRSQSRLHIYKSNNAEPEVPSLSRASARDQNQYVIFNDDRAMPVATLSFSENTQMEKRSRNSTREGMFSKANAEFTRSQTDRNHAYRCDERHIYFDPTISSCRYKILQPYHLSQEAVSAIALSGNLYGMKGHNSSADNRFNLSNGMLNAPSSSPKRKHAVEHSRALDDQHRATALLQHVAQPIKYLAAKTDSGMQKIPVYIDNGKLTVINPNTQARVFPWEVTMQVVPQQAAVDASSRSRLDDFAACHESNAKHQRKVFKEHPFSIDTILFNSGSPRII